MNFSNNWRDRRNFLSPSQYPFASYYTDTKTNMKHTFADDLMFNHFYLGDPLQKNLADTIITDENMAAKSNKHKLERENVVESHNCQSKEKDHMQVDNSRLAGITNFFSGVLSVISNVMFSKQKADDYSCNSSPEMASPSMWQSAKFSDENKILQDKTSDDDMSSEIFASEMSDCRSAAAHCQSKLDQVRLLLGSSKPCSLKTRRRPKKVFVEASSVEDCFEDAFSPEDFENLANESYIEYLSPVCYHDHSYHELECPEINLRVAGVPKLVPESVNLNSHDLIVDSLNTSSTVVNSSSVHDVPLPVSEKPKVFLNNIETIVTPKLNKLPEVVADNSLFCESTDIVQNVPESNITNNRLETEMKKELVESCEDKITKLKLLLQERRKKPNTFIEPLMLVEPMHNTLPPPISLESEGCPLIALPPRPKPSYRLKDKRFKNPNRCSNKHKRTRMKQNIDDDILFAKEIHTDDLSSVENSPSVNNMENYMKLDKMESVDHSQQNPIPCKEYFDEVCGRFHSSSVDSDDSFQIVFKDSPRYRRQSDCESEDSFIVFEESPDSCYTSNDVFGDSTDSEDCDSDSDMSDSGCGMFKLSASLSKSIGNLADDSLYMDHSEDEVDCPNVNDFALCDNVTDNCISDASDTKGLLLTERKKVMRKDLPTKRVHFSTEPPKVHVMRVWLFAAKQTRQRYWEQFVVDRERFKRRINDVDVAVSWVLKPQHRSRVMFQRFMPWWNAQKRQEIAEKKERENKEKERLRIEEIESGNDEFNKKIDQTERNTSSDVTKEDFSKNEMNAVNSERQLDKEESTSIKILEVDTDESKCNKVESESKRSVGGESPEKGKAGNDTLNSKDVDCQNSKENIDLDEKKENKSKIIENTKNCNKLYDQQIVPYNEKILDLNTGYSSGILNT